MSELEQLVTTGDRWKGFLRLSGDPWVAYHITRLRARMLREAVVAFSLGTFHLWMSTTAKLSSVAMLVHVTYRASPFCTCHAAQQRTGVTHSACLWWPLGPGEVKPDFGTQLQEKSLNTEKR